MNLEGVRFGFMFWGVGRSGVAGLGRCAIVVRIVVFEVAFRMIGVDGFSRIGLSDGDWVEFPSVGLRTVAGSPHAHVSKEGGALRFPLVPPPLLDAQSGGSRRSCGGGVGAKWHGMSISIGAPLVALPDLKILQPTLRSGRQLRAPPDPDPGSRSVPPLRLRRCGSGI